MSKDNTIKILEPTLPCNHPEHNPPNMRLFEAGTYKHTRPFCGEIRIFTIPLINF